MFCADQLQTELTAAFSVRGYIFQAVHDKQILELYLNYPDAEPLQPQTTADKVRQAIAVRWHETDWTEIEEAYLLARRLGNTDPEWEVPLDLDAIAPSDSASPTSDESSVSVATAHSVSDGEPKPLDQYCCVRNRQLISKELVPPPEAIAQLLEQFDQFPRSLQHEILGQLQPFFQGKGPLTCSNPELESWINQMEVLPGTLTRKASIWFSRYCADPIQTLVSAAIPIDPIGSSR